ncbi:uncharacterized protein C8Q71DRAFT_327765 [Rhodofomes roseus]|uniref:Secreted protein n=1 Tax=Rhodofomes roseus TaxID=34475 RepID=A0ABQ8KS68_9APHY|nr:uncharacterized protein C8Q71DRAFT_327765 [Rhodofomes roseus]KAH9841399.1 hypothetical protein C8Q71DRAFT_327765 [Rhodofomes roseus]
MRTRYRRFRSPLCWKERAWPNARMAILILGMRVQLGIASPLRPLDPNERTKAARRMQMWVLVTETGSLGAFRTVSLRNRTPTQTRSAFCSDMLGCTAGQNSLYAKSPGHACGPWQTRRMAP